MRVWFIIIGFILGLALLVFVVVQQSSVRKIGEEFSVNGVTLEKGENQDDACVKITKSRKLLGGFIKDVDGDGRVDFCDWCVCDSGCGNGDVSNDVDGDGLPDKCDSAPDNSNVFEPGVNCVQGENLFRAAEGAGFVCFP